MASASFRESMNNLGWSRRDPELPVNTQQTSGLLSSIKSLNPFGDSGQVRLPVTEGPGAPLPARNRREEEEAWFACESKSMAFSSLSHLLTAHVAAIFVGCMPCTTSIWIAIYGTRVYSCIY